MATALAYFKAKKTSPDQELRAGVIFHPNRGPGITWVTVCDNFGDDCPCDTAAVVAFRKLLSSYPRIRRGCTRYLVPTVTADKLMKELRKTDFDRSKSVHAGNPYIGFGGLVTSSRFLTFLEAAIL